jgi:hypothetical protein
MSPTNVWYPIVGAGANVHEFGRFEIADEFAI